MRYVTNFFLKEQTFLPNRLSLLSVYLFFVSVPPESIRIYDDHRVDKSILLGPYNEGTDVNLLCEVRGGKSFSI